MHDLFSSRPAQYGPLGADQTAGLVDKETEMAMLGRAGAVIAIQADEAAEVRRRLPGTRVLLAPMATIPIAAPQAGTGSDLLFIGSNTSPNVDGLRWFFDEVWPRSGGRSPRRGSTSRAMSRRPSRRCRTVSPCSGALMT